MLLHVRVGACERVCVRALTGELKFSVNPDIPPLIRDLKGELLKTKQEPAAVKPRTPAKFITQRLVGFDPQFKV